MALAQAFQVQEKLRATQLRLFDQSVVDTPSVSEGYRPGTMMIMAVANAADGIVSWGQDVALRDKQLRDFLPTESFLQSCVYSVSIRNAGFEWYLEGADLRKPKPRNTILAVEDILRHSNRGKGWENFVLQTCLDLYSQDNAAFVEVIRAGDSSNAPVMNLAHLDAARCVRTGDPAVPVLYRNRFGREIPLKWYQVVTIEEFPSAIETMYGVQYSAITRCLLAAQIIRDISIYKHEKVSGRFSRSVHLVSGVPQAMIDDALVYADVNNSQQGLLRYSQPTILASLDPSHPLSHVQLDMASLPDGFDEESTFKWYVTQLAAAFGVDYQEFAPLPGGNMGSGSQSETQHNKTRSKGPAAFMALIEHMINNNNLVPRNVKFKFRIADLTAESEKASARFTRGKDRALRVKAGELDLKAARELAVQDGDMPEYLLDQIDQREEEAQREEETQVQSDIQQEDQDPLTADQVTGGIESQNEQP